MPENTIDRFYQGHLESLPERQRPLIRSLVVSLIASRVEENPDKFPDLRASIIWSINDEFMQAIITENPSEALQFGIFLTNLSEHKNYETEWYYRWLRGNGVTILLNEELHERTSEYINTQKTEDVRNLILNLETFINLDIDGWTKESIFNTPEAFTMFVSLILTTSLENSPEVSYGTELFNIAKRKLRESEVQRVVNYYQELSDTRELYKKLEPFLD